MKHNYIKLMLSLLLCIASFSASAHDFEMDGIYYNITSNEDLTVAVTYRNSFYTIYCDRYSGQVSIPKSVAFDRRTYSVTSIGDQAFHDCYSVTSVTIPNSVTSIGWGAFQNCIGLTSVIIPNSVTEIKFESFSGCSSLSSITIPNGVTRIDNATFAGCTSLKTILIPDGVTSIEGRWLWSSSNGPDYYTPGAFEGCSSLISITIPNSVTSIGEQAFKDCSSLTSVTIPFMTTLCDNSFEGCYITNVRVPVTDYSAFCNNIALSGIYSSIRRPVQLIDGEGCEIKEYVVPEDVTSIGHWAFSNCTGLTSVSIPSTLTNIGNSAFYGCNNIESVKVPVINLEAFYNNKVLGYIYSCIGKPVQLIDSEGKEIKEYVVPDGVISIGDNAFRNCNGLTSVSIPSTLTNIGNSAFEGCNNINLVKVPIIDSATLYNNKALGYIYSCIGKPVQLIDSEGKEVKEYVVPDGVISIGSNAFRNCSGLTSVTIPNSLTDIGESAFDGCNSISNVKVPVTDLASFCSNKAIGLIYNHIGKKVQLIDSEGSEIKEYIVPEGVNSIGISAFRNCYGLTSITIPSSVKDIGESAFYNCGNLSSFAIPNSMTSISDNVFSGCSNLVSITIPNSVTTIGSKSFFGCSNLTAVTIPSNVTSIGSNAFSGCSGLTSVTIPDGMVGIGKNAFSDCYNIENVRVPVTDYSAFCNNKALGCIYSSIGKSVQLIDNEGKEINEYNVPESVISIGNSAFRNCSGLTTVTIPKSVTKIESNAFSGCNAIMAVKSFITEPFNISKFSEDTYRQGTLYIPNGTKELYSRFDGWREFLKIVEMDGDVIPSPNGECATPSIIVSGKKIRFECDTPGAEFTSYLTTSEEFTGSEVEISNKDLVFTLTVYATAPDYDRSQPATMKFVVKKSDVNGDGTVDVADIAAIISEMATKARAAEKE